MRIGFLVTADANPRLALAEVTSADPRHWQAMTTFQVALLRAKSTSFAKASRISSWSQLQNPGILVKPCMTS